MLTMLLVILSVMLVIMGMQVLLTMLVIWNKNPETTHLLCLGAWAGAWTAPGIAGGSDKGFRCVISL